MYSNTQQVASAIRRGYVEADKSGFNKWVLKACSSDDEPPKSKHVRRITLAMIRDTTRNPIDVIKLIHAGKEWREDPRVGAKALYLMLTILNHLPPQTDLNTIIQHTDAMYRPYQNMTFDGSKGHFSTAAQTLGAIIHAKGTLRSKQGSIGSNYYIEKSAINDNLIADLIGHLTTINYEANRFIHTATHSEIFALLVLCQPVVEEVMNAYILLRSLTTEGDAAKVLAEAERILCIAQEAKYLGSSIIYPPGVIASPKVLFPNN